MLPNTFPDIANIINTANVPVLILVVSENCEDGKTLPQEELERQLEEHSDPVIFYSMCIPESMMSFPRASTPTLYYFLPGNQMPVFWRHNIFSATVNEDLEIVKKMMTGLSYEQAKFNPEELETVLQVDYFLEQERETIKNFPPVFQQARGLAKEIWKTGKNAVRGLPVIVKAEVGFERYSLCESCEHFEQKTSRCTQCGCYMKTKTQLASASCPIGKWNAVV